MVVNRRTAQSPNAVSGSIAGRLALQDSVRSNESLRGSSLLKGLSHRDVQHLQALAGEASPLVGSKDEFEVGPPFIVWIGPALCCAMAYALYNIFIKKGSASIFPILGGVILQFVAALLGCVLLGVLVAKDGTGGLHYDKEGMFWSILAGVAVGVAEMLSFVVNGMGVPAVQSIPIIIGGSVLFGAVLGLLWLKEVMCLQGFMGIGLLILGIGLVATDPGPKVTEG